MTQSTCTAGNATCDALRVDIVGSFLRPTTLKDAFTAFAAGDIGAPALREIQDRAIEALVAEELRHGLPVVGDGEFRRRQFMESFSDVAGMEHFYTNLKASVSARTVGTPAPNPYQLEEGKALGGSCDAVTSRLRLTRNGPLEEYTFTATLGTVPAKVTIINPDRISHRFDPEGSRAAYPGGVDDFVNDVVTIERTMIEQLRAAGCPYVQIDAPGYTAYCDDEALAMMRGRHQDPEENLARAIRADNAIISGVQGVTFGVHLCRGNSRSQWHRKGGYDAIAERLFNELHYRRFMLEYDDERSGGFEPLRFMPKGKIAVLGLITTKSGDLEDRDALQRRIEEAAKFIPIDQLALSPQCGFASGIAGNLLTEQQQWDKIDLMLEVAGRVWGS